MGLFKHRVGGTRDELFSAIEWQDAGLQGADGMREVSYFHVGMREIVTFMFSSFIFFAYSFRDCPNL